MKWHYCTDRSPQSDCLVVFMMHILYVYHTMEIKSTLEKVAGKFALIPNDTLTEKEFRITGLSYCVAHLLLNKSVSLHTVCKYFILLCCMTAFVQAADIDEGENARIRYSLLPADHFAIREETGVIYPIAGAFKYEDTRFTVHASDAEGEGEPLEVNVSSDALTHQAVMIMAAILK